MTSPTAGAAGRVALVATELGTNLVAAGMSNAVVRFGHEFNGNWYPWSPLKDPAGIAAGGRAPICPGVALDARPGAVSAAVTAGRVRAGQELLRWD